MQNMVIEFISLLLTMAALKEMTGALAPFSYLVFKCQSWMKVLTGDKHSSLHKCDQCGKPVSLLQNGISDHCEKFYGF